MLISNQRSGEASRAWPSLMLRIVLQQFIQLLHFLSCLSDVFCSRTDAGLNIPWLGYDVYQVLLLFLERESTGLPSESRDDYGTLRRGALPLFQNLKFHSMTGGPG